METNQGQETGRDIRELIPGIKKVVHDTVRELRAQHERWGPQEHDDVVWAEILLEELGEACRASATCIALMHGRPWLLDLIALGNRAKQQLEMVPASKRPQRGFHAHGAYAELVQVAAVALQWAACIERRTGGLA